MISYSCGCRVCVSKFKAWTMCQCCEPSSRNDVTVFLEAINSYHPFSKAVLSTRYAQCRQSAHTVWTDFERLLMENDSSQRGCHMWRTAAELFLVWRSLIMNHCFWYLSSSFRFRVYSLENCLEKAGTCIIVIGQNHQIRSTVGECYQRQSQLLTLTEANLEWSQNFSIKKILQLHSWPFVKWDVLSSTVVFKLTPKPLM